MKAHLVVMGVSGCGKSTFGKRIADTIEREWIEGDDQHFPESIEKMKHGISLGDKDRFPWLDRLVKKMDHSKKPVVLACSALKRSYRDHLRTAKGTVFFLHLQIPQNILLKRLQNRKDHFFSPSLLDDQLLLLEELQAKELGYTVNSESELEKWLSVQFEQKKDGHLPK